ncbi:MAG: DUF4234 domain-containing protein [Clostridia bacterium]|nr:DUF4234 domain-containing protein [Clostridia bacterium]
MKKFSVIQLQSSLSFFIFGILSLLFEISFGVIKSLIDSDWSGIISSILEHNWSIYVHLILCVSVSLFIVLGKIKFIPYSFAGFIILNIYNLIVDFNIIELILLVINIFMLCFFTEKHQSDKRILGFLWLYIAAFILDIFFTIRGLAKFSNIVNDILGIIAYYFCIKLILNKEKIYVEQFENGYINMFVHCLLMLYSCGVWNFIWIYRTTRYLNTVGDGRKQNPIIELFLCMIPFYPIYWGNIVSRKIDKLCLKKNINTEISIICTILMTVIIFLPPLIMQNTINRISHSEL